MKNSHSPFGKLLCAIFGHRYQISRKVTSHITEYECKVCKCETTTTVTGHLDVLTPELKEINQTLADFYRKRHSLQTVA